MTAAHGREVDGGRVERVARAICAAGAACYADRGWHELADDERDVFRTYAAAALAADTGEAQQAVERVRALIRRLDRGVVSVDALRAVLSGAE